MQINKKTIIILIVVAVAAWLLWKRSKMRTVTADTGSGGGGESQDATSLDYILTHVDFNGTEREKINAVYNRAMTDKSYYQSILASANAKGYSFDQMVVLKALWALYNPTNSQWANERGWKLQQEVLKLNGQSLWA